MGKHKYTILIFLVFGFGFFWFLKASPKSVLKQVSQDIPQSKSIEVQNSAKNVQLEHSQVDAKLLEAQEGHLKWLAENPVKVEKVYDDGKLRSELEVAASEANRKQQVKMEVLRDVNEGVAPEPTENELRIFAEMMAAEGLKSAYERSDYGDY